MRAREVSRRATRQAPPETLRVLDGAVFRPSRLLVLLVIAAFALGLRVSAAAQYIPFAASLLLFGLPHGAVDHLVPARLWGRGRVRPSVLGVGALYLTLGGLYLLLWFTAPSAAFFLFITLTLFHWGAGDLYALLAFEAPKADPTRKVRALVLLVRGAAPMLVPLLAFPEVYRRVAASAVGLFFGSDALGGTSFVFGTTFRLAAGGLFAAIALFSFFLAWRAASEPEDWRFLRAYAGDTLLLVLYFAVVPPVLAVGLYFCLWHATRHIARLVLLDGGTAAGTAAGNLGSGRVLPRALFGFVRDAAPLTALALFSLLGLYFAVPNAAASPGALLALYLVLISALTLPHTAVVSYMDVRQGLWKCQRAPAGKA